MKASMKPTSDHDIIELFFQRNENAITETDRKYRAYLLTVAKGFVNDKEDAEECLNDTYHDTWNKIPPARPENLKAFLAVIMRRTAIDRLKHETRKKRIFSMIFMIRFLTLKCKRFLQEFHHFLQKALLCQYFPGFIYQTQIPKPLPLPSACGIFRGPDFGPAIVRPPEPA